MHKVSDAERQVLDILWENEPLAAAEVVELVLERTDWHEKTIKTLLTRLYKKGVVEREKRAGVYRYRSVIDKEDYTREEAQSFIQRFFGGRLSPLLANFIEHDQLDKKDIEEMEALLKKLKEDK